MALTDAALAAQAQLIADTEQMLGAANAQRKDDLQA